MTSILPLTENISGSTITTGVGMVSAVSPDDIKRNFDRLDVILFSVVIILLVMVATLVIDSFHVNSATYKEYSNKLQALEQIQKSNKEMEIQNSANQAMIIQQQGQIIKLLNKK